MAFVFRFPCHRKTGKAPHGALFAKDGMKPEPKVGWRLVDEAAPSLVKHHMPTGMPSLLHTMSHNCSCKPHIQNEGTKYGYTIVLHN